jgi:hypothetical protein
LIAFSRRLPDKTRDEGAERFRLDLGLQSHLIRKAYALDVEVASGNACSSVARAQSGRLSCPGDAQEIPSLAIIVSAARGSRYERGDGVQRVEQEMRVQLVPERFQPGFASLVSSREALSFSS